MSDPKGRRLVKPLFSVVNYGSPVRSIVEPHSFHHTCSTHMIQNGTDTRHIQELLGHESLDATPIYTHVAVTDLRKVLEKYHPLEQEKP